MRLLPTMAALAAAALLPACESQRTIVAGPTQTSLSASSGGGEVDPNARFQAADPFGYQSNGSGGLNALSGKMFSGNTSQKDMRSFNQTRDFVAKRYGGSTKELGTSDRQSFLQKMTSRFSGTSASESGNASEASKNFREQDRSVAASTNRNQDRAANVRDFPDSDRTARTGYYYPAEKDAKNGFTQPKMVNADKGTAEKITSLIMSGTNEEPATVDDIRNALGKP